MGEGESKFFEQLRKLISRAKEYFKGTAIYYRGAKVKNFLGYYYYKIFKSPRYFVFQGKTHLYFYHNHNLTWTNERAVEIPIVWDIVKRGNRKSILEVGNVFSYYFSVNHDILDKYESVEGVINKDVVDFKPSKKYDLIVSISTLEHVGWDEKPQDSKKILVAIQNLKKLLNPGGEIVVTLPLGYNPEMDKLLKEGKIHFTQRYYLKRISKDNKWVETGWEDVCGVGYGNPYPGATAIIIGIIKKKVISPHSNFD